MAILGGIGSLIYIVSWLWLIYLGYKNGGILWAIINVFLQPFTGLAFCIVKKTGWLQLGLMILGLVLMIAGYLPSIQNTIQQISR